jgi:Ca2+-transporting ATPase
MITGDNKLTAESVARQLAMPPGKAIVGAELAKMSNEELENVVEDVAIFARVEPLHKLRIVNALKKRGHVVAMTGDGVNDAPA